jgi:hypothetical protein
MTPTDATTPETATSTPSTSKVENATEPTASPTTPVRRENVRDKSIRLLTHGRLRVLRVDSDFIAAECRGDSGEVYNLLWRDQRWSCSCPARTDCSHLRALWAVVAVNR